MNTNLTQKINAAEKQFVQQLDAAHSNDALEAVRIAFLGRKGLVAELMSLLKELDVEQKRTYGPLLNQFKQQCEHRISEKQQQLLQVERASGTREQTFDVTAYVPGTLHGSLHVYTRIIEELEDIFLTMGFQIVDSAEVETDYHNFGALNIPDDHPARESHDTFWLTLPGLLMRTHTSTAEIRVMETQRPPLAIFSTGRCYRNEATDASHDFMFMQAESLIIDKGISMANLLGTAKTFLQKLFDTKSISLRVRPGYFPFVEPGVEIDCSCPFCSSGCSICKKTGWIELLGAGLTHPEVLRKQNINPEIYSGFAMGMGIERLAMIKYGITDIRLFRSNNLRFLNQF